MTFEDFCDAVDERVRGHNPSAALRVVTGDMVWQYGDYRSSLEPHGVGVRCRLWHATDAHLTTQNVDLELREEHIELASAVILALGEGPGGPGHTWNRTDL